MILEGEQIANLVLGCVANKTETPPNEQYKNSSTFVRLSGGAVMLLASCTAADLPADGSWAVFEVQQSRSGRVAKIVRWGWLDGLSEIYGPNPKFDIEWVRTVNNGQATASGGITRNGNGTGKK